MYIYIYSFNCHFNYTIISKYVVVDLVLDFICNNCFEMLTTIILIKYIHI